jgi:tetratricopeptide (TPR) repeat protein
MSILTAENSFRNGLMALVDSRNAEATRYFRSAMQIDRDRGIGRNWIRYLSYYGYSLAREGVNGKEAVELCERAVRLNSHDPEILLNLGRVYARSGRTTWALDALERGLQISPAHKGLLLELRKLDRRSRPPFSFIPRQHPLNRATGRLLRIFRRNR